MKFAISREIKAGKYVVSAAVTEISEDERAKIKKFGPPMVSIAPQTVFRRDTGFVNSVPLHSLNNAFEFNTEGQADNFYKSLVVNIKEAVDNLKKQEDKFSLSKEYEF